MKKDEITERIEAIQARMLDLENDPLDGLAGVHQHLTSPYYAAALEGRTDTLIPAVDGPTFRHRLAELGLASRFADTVAPLTKDLPDSNGQRWHHTSDRTVGMVADDFLFNSFQGTANLVRITPQNYRDHIGKIDLLLLTSTWHGVGDEWDGASNPESAVRHLLEHTIIPENALSGVPIVFYSAEDPPNYGRFLSLAKKSDFIFTSAAESVEKYQRNCPEAQSVQALTFSVSPLRHNPVGSRRHRIEEVLFAGSWHRHEYPQRRATGSKIFDGVQLSDRELVIIDRNSGLDFDRGLFPERFIPRIANAIDDNLLLKIDRISEISIALNSEIESQTMFANRVVELLAMGTTVVSNYNSGVNSKFPNVLMPDSTEDARDMINATHGDHLYRNQMAGLRSVYSNHVNQSRMDSILKTVGFSSNKNERSIGIICENERFANSFIEGQATTVPMTAYRTADECRSSMSTVAIPVNLGITYGSNFAQDLVNAFKFTDSSFVSKAAGNSNNHEYISSPIAAATTAFWVDPHLSEHISGQKTPQANGYVADPFEVGAMPRERIQIVDWTPSLSVIIPVYNNGLHLLHKCFESLRRSTIFDQMELLLVDDGSTDRVTLAIIQHLEQMYPNVRSLNNEPGGSGSASRPRNQGLEVARAEWVTYLDPDNEAINDGYAKLLDQAVNNSVDFSIGDVVRNDSTRKVLENTKVLRRELVETDDEYETWEVPSDILTRIKYQPMSIQALVANATWLRSLDLEQPIGAIGQDSYFFQQMLHYSQKVSLLDLPIHTYYAAVANSTVNSIGADFYRKYLPLELSRSTWLAGIGLLDDYIEQRLEGFVKGWYVKKLDQVPPEERAASVDILHRIVALYGKTVWNDQELATFFQENQATDDRPRSANEPLNQRLVDIGEITDLKLKGSSETWLLIRAGKEIVHVVVAPKHGCGSVVVFFNRAQDVKRRQHETVSEASRRLSGSDDIDASCIYVTSSTQQTDDRINQGWGQNDEEECLAPAVSQIVKLLTWRLGVFSGVDRLYVGSSDSGSQALILGSFDPGSQCLIDIPQLGSYKYGISPAGKEITDSSDGAKSLQDLSEVYPEQTAAMRTFNTTGYMPKTRYLLNTPNRTHIPVVLQTLFSSFTERSYLFGDQSLEVLTYVSPDAVNASMPRHDFSRHINEMLSNRSSYAFGER